MLNQYKSLRLTQDQIDKLGKITEATGISAGTIIRAIIDAMTTPNFDKEFFQSFKADWILKGDLSFEKLYQIVVTVAGYDYGKFTKSVLYDTPTGVGIQKIDEPSIYVALDGLIKVLNAIHNVKTITQE